MMTTMKKTTARVLALALVICLVFSLAVTASATMANESVTDAKKAVVQIQTWFNDPDNWAQAIHLSSGTGFLINDTTVVTNEHVVNSKSDSSRAAIWADYVFQLTGLYYTPEDVMEHMELRVIVLRDVYIIANVRQSSAEMDYAILTLTEQLHNRTYLPLRSSDTLQQTETVYALGYPGDIEDMVDQAYYDADDVTITSGSVNKVDRFDFTAVESTVLGGVERPYKNVDCVENSATITGGNSGGPLVDANGAVVGINVVTDGTRNLAIASDQLITTLDALGIDYDEYQPEPDPTEAPTEAATEAPTEAPTEAATEAPTEAATEAPTEAPTEPVKDEEGGNGTMILLIVAAIAVVVVVVVVVMVMSKGKKSAAPAAPVGGGYVPPAPPRPTAPTAPASTGFTSVNPVPAQPTAPIDAGETTVLNQGAGETTVLSNNVNGGTLTRKRNNETIKVNADNFVIGRERKSVNYCISDNSSISRTHVKLTVRNGVTYLTDMNTANGTFVNGVKVMPRQEVALKNGDKITLADEDLEYKI